MNDSKPQAESLAEYVRKIVDTAPPLTNEQRDRIALMLPRPVRAVDDPVTLAKAGALVRGAMERAKPEAEKAKARATHPSVIRAREMGIDL